MTVTMPTILLIHGCFGDSDIFDKLLPLLEKGGYDIVKASLPSSKLDSPEEVTAQKDIDSVRETHLLPLVETQSKDVVIVAHSYGGVVAAPAALGLSKTDRLASGAHGGVLGLVFIAGNVAKEGTSMIEAFGGQWPPWFLVDTPRPGLASMEPALDTMFNDVEPPQQQEVLSLLRPYAYGCLKTKVSRPCWTEKGYTGRLAYIRTTEDRVNPPFVQDMSMQMTGAHWDVIDINAAHAPMFSRPEEVAQDIITFTTRFSEIKA